MNVLVAFPTLDLYKCKHCFLHSLSLLVQFIFVLVVFVVVFLFTCLSFFVLMFVVTLSLFDLRYILFSILLSSLF